MPDFGDAYHFSPFDGMNSLSARGYRLDVLADDLLGAEPDKGAQTEKKNQQIIDLTEPDENVRQEIDRRDDVGQEQDEEKLGPDGHSPVFQQPPEELEKTRQMIKELPEPARA